MSGLREMLMVRVMGRIESIKDYYQSLDELFEGRPPPRTWRVARLISTAKWNCFPLCCSKAKKTEVFFLFPDASTTAGTLMLATNAFPSL